MVYFSRNRLYFTISRLVRLLLVAVLDGVFVHRYVLVNIKDHLRFGGKSVKNKILLQFKGWQSGVLLPKGVTRFWPPNNVFGGSDNNKPKKYITKNNNTYKKNHKPIAMCFVLVHFPWLEQFQRSLLNSQIQWVSLSTLNILNNSFKKNPFQTRNIPTSRQKRTTTR